MSYTTSKNDTDHQEFSKYDEQGPYHWRQMRNNIKRFNAGLAARYNLAFLMIKDNFVEKKEGTILDIGCGDGYFTSLLAGHFKNTNIEGYDFSATGIRFANEFNKYKNVRFFCENAFSRNGKFDLIVATDVIEHLFDIGGFLNDCKKHLKPGGEIFVSTPIRIKEIPDDKFHHHEFFFFELEKLFSEYGFLTLDHSTSHDFSILEKYNKRCGIFGVGKMRVNKYIFNIKSLYFDGNPFQQSNTSLPTMQYLYAKLDPATA